MSSDSRFDRELSAAPPYGLDQVVSAVVGPVASVVCAVKGTVWLAISAPPSLLCCQSCRSCAYSLAGWHGSEKHPVEEKGVQRGFDLVCSGKANMSSVWVDLVEAHSG